MFPSLCKRSYRFFRPAPLLCLVGGAMLLAMHGFHEAIDSDAATSPLTGVLTVAAAGGIVLIGWFMSRSAAAAEEPYRAIFEASSNAVLIFDRQGRIVEVNAAACQLYGYTHDQFTRLSGRDIVGPTHAELFNEFREKAGRGEAFAARSRDVRSDGKQLEVEVRGAPLKFQGQLHLLAVVTDLTERNRAQRGLEEYAAALQAANRSLEEYSFAAQAATRAKSDFLANMSHEIRTPLTSILGYTELVLGEEVQAGAPAERIGALDTVLRNGNHLLALINDVLDLSKIEAGHFDVEVASCDVIKTVVDVQSIIAIRAREKGLEFAVDWPSALPASVQTDPIRLRQILINLLGNAVKFTDAGSVRLSIELDTSEPEPWIAFTIADTGSGISQDDLETIFEPFQQGEGHRTDSKLGGTGLGLTISQRFADMLGGQITAQSELGRGSRFRLTLPIGLVDGVEMVNPRTHPTTATPIALPGEVKKGRPEKLAGRILLAEDGADNQRLISFILRRAGADVEAVDDGRQAVDAVLRARKQGHPFDLVLMDMQMPVLDGFGATAELRELGYQGPVVALTAHAMKEDRKRCLEAGCNDYATKPINRQTLLALAAEYLDKNGKQPTTSETTTSEPIQEREKSTAGISRAEGGRS